METQLSPGPPPAPSAGYPRDFWYAAVASQRLGERPIAVRLLDWDIALYRGPGGAVGAVLDRCAHRGAQLSLGEVVEGALACRYHGWRYSADGRCAHIPSLAGGQDIAKGVGVRGFPCAEADGYVWVWTGEGPPSPPEPPRIPEFERFDWTQGAVELKCSALAAIENNLDWCHPVFTHPFTHGQFFVNQAVGFRDQAVEIRRLANGLVVFAPPTQKPDDPIPTGAWVVLEYQLPDRVTVSFSGGPNGPMVILMHIVPTGTHTCRQEWLQSGAQARAGASPAIGWADAVPAIFEQDRLVLESVQRAVSREGQAFERSVEADAATLLARRIYALATAAGWEAARDGLPPRRVVTVRA